MSCPGSGHRRAGQRRAILITYAGLGFLVGYVLTTLWYGNRLAQSGLADGREDRRTERVLSSVSATGVPQPCRQEGSLSRQVGDCHPLRPSDGATTPRIRQEAPMDLRAVDHGAGGWAVLTR